MKSLDDLMGSGDADISGIAHSIYARLDKANTASEMRAASLDEQMDEVLGRSELDAQLAERKQKLGPEINRPKSTRRTDPRACARIPRQLPRTCSPVVRAWQCLVK